MSVIQERWINNLERKGTTIKQEIRSAKHDEIKDTNYRWQKNPLIRL